MPFAIAGPVLGLVGASMAADSASESAANSTAAQERMAAGSAKLGQDQLDFNKQVYADGAGDRTQASQIARDVSAAQLAQMKQQSDIAAEYNAYNKSTFRPLEQKIVDGAQGYDTAARRAEAITGATSDVEQGYASANASNARAMQRMGVTPGSGRMQALMADQAIAKANAIAGATTGAVRNVETVGAARMADAANMGRNLPSSQAVAASGAINAGNSAVSNGMQGLQAQNSGLPNLNGAYGQAISAMGTAGSLYGQAGNAYRADGNQMGAALGSIGSSIGNYGAKNGGFGGMANMFGFGTSGNSYRGTSNDFSAPNYENQMDLMSDQNIKSGTGKPMDIKEALAQIVDTKVDENWRFDPAKGGPDENGQLHDGPMAQEVRRTMGNKAAPGGKRINPQTMNGKLLGGMQELARRMSRLEKGATK